MLHLHLHLEKDNTTLRISFHESIVIDQLREPSSPKHFNQTQILMASSDLRSEWVLSAPEPPSLWRHFSGSLSKTVSQYRHKLSSLRDQPGPKPLLSLLQALFPILHWGRHYSLSKFRSDLLAGLTIASLCIPQSIGYATLAHLDPQYGLYTSVVPPLIYAVMGSSRDIAVGPVAVVSLLLSSMVQKLIDPSSDQLGYTKLVLTTTLFAGIFQASFGLFRLGFLVDFLSHAVIVGFMAGAAIVIGLQQLKGLFGMSHFTNKTDVISVLKAAWASFQQPWNPRNFFLGTSFLIFILSTRFVAKRKKKLFWLAAISPLVSVIMSTLIVYVTRSDKNGVNIVKHVKGGLNPSSINELELKSPHIAEVAKIGLVAALVALTESVAVGRSFASLKGYHIDGNKEMLSIGLTNIIGSFTSCYVATGSFSRTAVNYAAGCETSMSNVVMGVTVMISLQFLTKLLYYTPTAILASIILSALPGLIDISEAHKIWKLDKLDFLASSSAFLGVLFFSVEIGLLLAVAISFMKIILISIRPGAETLGKLPGVDLFCDVNQYPMAVKPPGTLILRLKSPLLCFANASFVRQRIIKWVAEGDLEDDKGNTTSTIQLLILDISNLVSIDTSGISCLEELHQSLVSQGKQLAIASPTWEVIHKLKASNFVTKIGGRVFLTVGEAIGCKSEC